MKLSPFMTQVKKDLKKQTKKQLIENVLIWIEMNAEQSLQEWIRYEELFQELLEYKKLAEQNEWFLKSAESALIWKDNLSVWQFIKNKYFR